MRRDEKAVTRVAGDGSPPACTGGHGTVLWEGAGGQRGHLKSIPEDALGTRRLGSHI